MNAKLFLASAIIFTIMFVCGVAEPAFLNMVGLPTGELLTVNLLFWLWAADTLLCSLLFVVFMVFHQKVASQFAVLVFAAVAALGQFAVEHGMASNLWLRSIWTSSRGSLWMWILPLAISSLVGLFCGKIFDQRDWMDLEEV